MISRFISSLQSALAVVFFRARPLWFGVFFLATVLLGWQATQLDLQARFAKMLPVNHPFVQNYLDYRDDLSGSSNALRVVVENRDGDIYAESFQKKLKKINQAVFFVAGVNRPMMKSLWTPNVRYMKVTAQGFSGGAVVPDDYDGDRQSLAQLRENVEAADIVGSLVGLDQQSAVIYAPLLSQNPDTGEPLDYERIASDLEQIRAEYNSENIRIHITGYAMLVGTLIQAAEQVTLFFAVALLVTLGLLFVYARCLRSAVVPVFCSLIAVVWQLGVLQLLNIPLNPYSMLVPFLVFAIGVSHGVQMVNNIGHGLLHGETRLQAARGGFLALLAAGLTALISDAVGFATLFVIEVPVIQDLALAASVGIAVVVLTNLVLLPLIMSYVGVSRRRLERLENEEGSAHPIWHVLQRFTERRFAVPTVVIVAIAFAGGLYISQDLRVGDLDAGAPELRPDSRYNQDARYINKHYGASSDIFVVMVATPAKACTNYDTLAAIDRFVWHMTSVSGVQSAQSLAGMAKQGWIGLNEGNFKWYALTRNQRALDSALRNPPKGMITADCSMTPVRLYLGDHRADTLERVVEATKTFNKKTDTGRAEFLMAAGNAGVQAATNIVIDKAQYRMLAWVYGVVALLCLLTFRSIRAVACIFVPLMLTSVLCQALMVLLGIGVKVSTLPVIALGVGIGVDYGIYIFSRLRGYLDDGLPLGEAYFEALKTSGRAVALTGLTLAIGVATWVLSPIKFQADMGMLLTFMFLWNMLGALIVIPAMASLLIKPETNGAHSD